MVGPCVRGECEQCTGGPAFYPFMQASERSGLQTVWSLRNEES
jgi:hypothetical protein